MEAGATTQPLNLPAQTERGLGESLEAAKKAFGGDLRSVVLYGSGAEGKLRATSDVNLLLVLSEFAQGKADELREPMRMARGAINLKVMFLLQSEVAAAFTAFAQKFAGIQLRHRVLFGEDPFAGITASRQNEILHLRQELLNLVMRLRATYVLEGLREEQLALVAAEAAGPLRSCAATLLALEGRPAASPKAALEQIGSSRPANAELLQQISQAREQRFLPPGAAAPTVFGLIELAREMHARAQALL